MSRKGGRLCLQYVRGAYIGDDGGVQGGSLGILHGAKCPYPRCVSGIHVSGDTLLSEWRSRYKGKLGLRVR